MNDIFFTADPHLGHDTIVLHCKRNKWIIPNPNYDPSKKFHFKYNNPDMADINAHDEALIEYWNKRVSKKGTVYIHGDFAYKDHRKYIQALNGKKVLIKGNHDKMSHDCYNLFKEWDLDDPSLFSDVSKENKSILKRFKNGDMDIDLCNKSIISSLWGKFMQLQNFEDIDQMSSECYNSFQSVHEMGLRRRIDNKDITLCHYAMLSWASSCHGAYHTYGHSHGRMPEWDNRLMFDVGVDVWDYAPIPWEVVIEKMSRKKFKSFGDGESKPQGTYSLDPDERVEQTRAKNLDLLKEMGVEIF